MMNFHDDINEMNLKQVILRTILNKHINEIEKTSSPEKKEALTDHLV